MLYTETAMCKATGVRVLIACVLVHNETAEVHKKLLFTGTCDNDFERERTTLEYAPVHTKKVL